MKQILPALLLLTACTGDETISGYADRTAIFRLSEIDGASYPASATIGFPEKGVVRGDAPCNGYSARQTVPYPWFELGPIISTKRACPDLAQEARFFDALAQMSLIEVKGGILILTNEDGREMTFQRVTE